MSKMCNKRFWFRILILMILFAASALATSLYYNCWSWEEGGCRIPLLASLVFFVWPLSYFALIAIGRYIFYRETPVLPPEELPRCTVIMPAYNEGQHVFEALASICGSDYPADKLEIIAVNDGSIDDTLLWINRAAEKFPGRIRVVDLKQNGGKRFALYSGFRMGSGDVFVTIDSDSQVEPDALAKMVSPIVRDSRIGAVSGNVRVANSDGGAFPAMIDSGFTFAFDFIRAGQSVWGSVFCTPGALSAYRRETVLPLLNEWRDQKFMGRPSGIGEDRALTNLVLRAGKWVTLQRSALLYTNVPETYKSICRMLLRWERSNIRENFEMYRFIFRNFNWRDARRWFMLFTLLEYSSMTLLPGVMIGFSLYNVVLTDGAVLFITGAVTLLWASLPAAINLHRNSTKLVWFSFVYGIVHALTLFWVVPYALVTVGNSRWLTRIGANSAGKF